MAGCKAKIEEIVAKLDAETVVKLEVDRRFHSVLIGRKGRRVTELRERTGAQINFPRRNATGDEANIIVVSGEPDAVAACQAEIEAVVQELASEVEAYVDMPTRFHGPSLVRKERTSND